MFAMLGEKIKMFAMERESLRYIYINIIIICISYLLYLCMQCVTPPFFYLKSFLSIDIYRLSIYNLF